ncbi:hypothetical protein B0A49_12871, partial [Cryomyces minteri]
MVSLNGDTSTASVILNQSGLDGLLTTLATATNVYDADMTKVALITGGASGMGLEVAKALSKRGGWQINLLDLNAERGEEAASSLGKTAKFHQTDVGQYKALSTTFDNIFKSHGRLDFVFANAGVVERDSFYAHHPSGAGPPPAPDLRSVDIDLKA